MTAKEYLKQLRRLDIMIDQKIKELEELRSKRLCVSGIDYSKAKANTPPAASNGAFVRVVDRIVDLEAEINREIDNYVDKKHRIINQIQALKNNKYVEILYKHYVEFKRLEVIAVEMNFTYQYIRELHGYALKEFQRIYKNLQNPIENLQKNVV